MKLIGLVLLAFLVSGCVDGLYHKKRCLQPDKEGYQWCHHNIEYWDETKCVGSCAVEAEKKK